LLRSAERFSDFAIVAGFALSKRWAFKSRASLVFVTCADQRCVERVGFRARDDVFAARRLCSFFEVTRTFAAIFILPLVHFSSAS
jgi:hypothetical protein